MLESSAEAVPAAPVSPTNRPKFGLLLRKLRTEAGLSQDGLAELAGISAKTIGALEQGVRRAAHDDTIHRIANALRLASAERDALLGAAQHSRARRPEKADETPRNNLPASLTTFVERREVEDVAALLDVNRLVTITGTGGVGKTRTAIEVARRATHRDHRFWFIDLSRLRGGDKILSELASVLGIRSTDTGDAFAAVARRLDAEPSRLLIDNCEHVLDGLADLVPRLLQSCNSLRILATSREPLSLSFEASYRLPSLRVPTSRVATLEEALEYSALRLFFARTESEHAGWLRKPASLEKVSRLCRELDGIPLAIELAASRVSTLGLDMLLKEVTRGLTASGKRDYPERHQTMTSTIAWSYDLLDTTEQTVLRRLSVFGGSFRLDVAQRVCADVDLPAYAIVDACHRLAQKSLIVVDYGDPMRYHLLGAIRAFGESRMSAIENETMHHHHILWLRELSDVVHHNPPGLALESILPDFDNVRAGVDRCVERGGEDDCLNAAAIAGGFRRLWFQTNRNRELKCHVDYLLARVDPERHLHVVSRLLLAACLYTPRRDFPSLLARVIPVLVADGNHVAAAVMLATLANYQVKSGDVAAANRSLCDAFGFLKDIDPVVSRAYWRCLMERAWISCVQGDVEQASADFSQLASLLSDATDPDRVERSKLQVIAAEIAVARGDTLRAISLLNRSLEQSENWSVQSTFEVRNNLAWYHTALGNGDIALQIVRTVLNNVLDLDWSYDLYEYFLILIPAAAAAVTHNNARLGAVILGHCKRYWLHERPILATQAPAYEKLLELLDAHVAAAEMSTLFEEGAAMPPGEFLHYVRADGLFASTAFASSV